MTRTEKLLRQNLFATSIAVGILGLIQVSAIVRLAMTHNVLQLAQASLEKIRPGVLFGGEPNGVAHFIAILFPLLLYIWKQSRSRVRTRIVGLGALAALVGILFTLSRGGLLALLAGILVSFRHHINRKFVSLFLLLVIVVVIPFSDIWIENITARPDSVTKRLGNVIVGMRSFLEFPIFGSGLGTFQHLHQYVSFQWPTSLFDRQDPALNKSAHNLYVYLLAETGILSFVFFIAFWIQLCFSLRSLKYLSRLAKPARGWVLIQYLLGASVALLVSRLFTDGLYVYAFWVSLAFLVSAVSIMSRKMIESMKHSAIENRDRRLETADGRRQRVM